MHNRWHTGKQIAPVVHKKIMRYWWEDLATVTARETGVHSYFEAEKLICISVNLLPKWL